MLDQHLNDRLAEMAVSMSPRALREHIVRKVRSMAAEDPRAWSADMRNLIQMFEIQHDIVTTPRHQMRRLRDG